MQVAGIGKLVVPQEVLINQWLPWGLWSKSDGSPKMRPVRYTAAAGTLGGHLAAPVAGGGVGWLYLDFIYFPGDIAQILI